MSKGVYINGKCYNNEGDCVGYPCDMQVMQQYSIVYCEMLPLCHVISKDYLPTIFALVRVFIGIFS